MSLVFMNCFAVCGD